MIDVCLNIDARALNFKLTSGHRNRCIAYVFFPYVRKLIVSIQLEGFEKHLVC